jgi:hypothetical protein
MPRRLMPGVDMTSVVKFISIVEEHLPYQPALSGL